ncbi:TPA: HdeA/HdeB family chaperone, partial [Klebsiella pneumoniae]
MKVKSLVFGAIGALFLTSAAHAADHKKPVNSWTCEDFLAVNED